MLDSFPLASVPLYHVACSALNHHERDGGDQDTKFCPNTPLPFWFFVRPGSLGLSCLLAVYRGMYDAAAERLFQTGRMHSLSAAASVYQFVYQHCTLACFTRFVSRGQASRVLVPRGKSLTSFEVLLRQPDPESPQSMVQIRCRDTHSKKPTLTLASSPSILSSHLAAGPETARSLQKR